ncbi:MAG: glycine cleavage system protein GcvH [Akkermansia sp.]|nr:glycine cleavage system protein GcvH [Akkermansia sp.]MBR1978964.1 glycine cleavage system protein GcvH [Akkermansia sp.]MBR3945352.1 glycine cleavage system protein GcvH [Akkermansia sp.]
MSTIPADYKYSSEHEWVSPAVDGVVTLGISDFAQSELGDVVYVDLPEVGNTYAAGDSIAAVESVKAASEVYTPVSGEIVEVNEALDGEPGIVNSDACGEGWICKIKLSEPGELDGLMDAAAYEEFCK